MASNRTLKALALTALLGGGSLSAQAICGLSVGGGYGGLREDFADQAAGGASKALAYSGPAAYLGAELDWGRLYMDMGLSVILSPKVSLGGTAVDTTGYEMNLGLDFTALGLGYLHPLSDRLSLGGALGFHVTAPQMTPPGEDTAKLGLGGYYGLIGLSIAPRLRYKLSDSFALTATLPIGLDFGAMSEDVVVFGMDTGHQSPAIVTPSTLKPEFKGVTVGAYVSIGYFFQMAR
jgi:hypothetical protein